jgi:predicted phosphodiesterase
MKRIGIISDVHANLPALEAVLGELSNLDLDRIVCCGDLVDYAPWPKEVIRRIQDMDITSVMGNHDAAVAGLFPVDYFSADALVTSTWTKGILSADEVRFLTSLEQVHTEEEIVIFHGSLRGPLWEYMHDLYVAEENFRLLTRPVGLFGHSHIQGGYVSLSGVVRRIDPHRTLNIMPGAKYMINPGSVGQPRDGDPRAAYAVLELGNGGGSVSFKRVSYDVGLVMRSIDRAGFPRSLAERLAIGR